MRWRRRTRERQGQPDFGWANVSLRANVIYVQSYSRPPGGPYIANEWLRVLTQDTDDTVLGNTVREALHNSQDNVKGLAAGREQAVAALLHAAGVRSSRPRRVRHVTARSNSLLSVAARAGWPWPTQAMRPAR